MLFSQAFRFLIAGGINTVLTYLIYLGLLQLVHYQLAYLFSFMLGIGISYTLNSLFVFRVKVIHFRRMLLYPSVYFVQYVLGAVCLHILVKLVGISPELSGIVTALITVPVTFLLSRFILMRKH